MEAASSPTVPSLRYLAAEAVALNVVKGHIPQLFDDLFSNVSDTEKACSTKEKQTCKCLTQKTAGKLCNALPKELVKPVACRMYRMISEIHQWIRDHYQVIKHIGRDHCLDNLCWFPDGTIDRTKTAFLLSQNESIDISVRFVIACDYFFQMDIMLLWQTMTASEKDMVHSIDFNQSVQFWVTLMKKTAKSSWTQRMKKYLGLGKILPLMRK